MGAHMGVLGAESIALQVKRQSAGRTRSCSGCQLHQSLDVYTALGPLYPISLHQPIPGAGPVISKPGGFLTIRLAWLARHIRCLNGAAADPEA